MKSQSPSNTNLVFDMSNMLYKTFHVHAREKLEDITALAFHSSLLTLNKYHKKYKPTRTVFVFDRENWRKYYTQNSDCYSGKIYKGQRRQQMTPSERKRYETFLEFVTDFENMIRNHTGITCLSGDMLEADDLIGGFAEVYSDQEDVVIVTADKDMLQLLRFARVTLVDPTTGEQRSLKEWNNDADYFMFCKQLRGDIGDNLQSAYPRLRTTKIKEAYDDPYKRINLLKETWTNQEGRVMEVGLLFEENELLMNLLKQPTCIRRKIFETIEYGMNNTGTFSHFHFLKLLGKYQLKNISKQLESFIPLLIG